MASDLNYSQMLRPIGQMLEPLQIESFSLKVEDGGVSVLADKPAPAPAPKPEVSLRVTWQIFRRKKPESPPEDPQPNSGSLELRYSHDDILRMDAQGQSKRQRGGAGSPEAHDLSQILRAVGAFVDQKQGRLLAVSKDGQDIAIDYESALKRNQTEKFTVATLYDFWVKMYLQRRARS